MSTNNVEKFQLVEKRRQESAIRISQAREEAGKNQTEAAKYIGVNRSTLSGWENNNKGVIGVDAYLKMAKLYTKPLEYLMALDIILESGIELTSPEALRENENINEIESEVSEIEDREILPGANPEKLRFSLMLIQSFLESFEEDEGN